MVICSRIFSSIALPILSMLFVACGSGHDESDLNAQPEAKPLFVVMGGNTTCKNDSEGRQNSPFVSSLFKSAQSYIWNSPGLRDRNWNFIASCYTDTATVYFVDSQDPQNVKAAERQAFEAYVQAAANSSSGLFIAGHSYGGWLAMKSAHSLTETLVDQSKPFGLYTVDPISRVHCSFSTPGGCTAAPQDFSGAQKGAISTVTSEWLNFYQTNTFYLHSSSIAEADDNMRLSTSHTNIDGDRRVWERIQASVNEKLGGLTFELVDN